MGSRWVHMIGGWDGHIWMHIMAADFMYMGVMLLIDLLKRESPKKVAMKLAMLVHQKWLEAGAVDPTNLLTYMFIRECPDHDPFPPMRSLEEIFEQTVYSGSDPRLSEVLLCVKALSLSELELLREELQPDASMVDFVRNGLKEMLTPEQMDAIERATEPHSADKLFDRLMHEVYPEYEGNATIHMRAIEVLEECFAEFSPDGAGVVDKVAIHLIGIALYEWDSRDKRTNAERDKMMDLAHEWEDELRLKGDAVVSRIWFPYVNDE